MRFIGMPYLNSGHPLYSELLRNGWGGHCMKRANYSCDTSTHLWPLAYVCTESECVNTRTWVQRNQTSLQLLYVLMVLCRWCTSTKHSSFHLFLSFHYNISCHNLWLALSYSICSCIQNAQFADYYYFCTIQRLFLLLHRSSLTLPLSASHAWIQWLMPFDSLDCNYSLDMDMLCYWLHIWMCVKSCWRRWSQLTTHNSQNFAHLSSRLYIQDMIFRNKPYCPRFVLFNCCACVTIW